MTLDRVRPARLVPCVTLVLALAGPVAAVAQTPGPTSAVAPTEWSVPELPQPQPISAGEYATRRAALAAEMAEGVFVALGAPAPAADFLPFIQDANFRFLTGITEPNAALLMIKGDGEVREILFVRPRNPAREVWEGERLGVEGAEALTDVPSRTIGQFDAALDSLLAQHSVLYTFVEVPSDPATAGTLTREQQILAGALSRHPDTDARNLTGAVRRLRASKSPAELDRLRRAIYITTLAQRAAMRAIEPGMNEFEVEALIEYTFRRYGAERPAFASIVGSGPNSTSLHYNENDRFMNAGDVVVMDVGASYRGYAADVTRTVPVDGTFSPEQRAIYGIVLAAQKAAEAESRAGASWRAVNQAANRVIAEGLARTGLIDAPDATFDCGNPDDPAQCPQYRLYYMHGLGHGIGLHVHDPDSYAGPGPSRHAPGAAFTIEPGIYVRDDVFAHLPDTEGNRAMIQRLAPAAERYRNIGVRIEDDYFITPDGVERITAGVPREITEIEALMREEAVTARTRTDDVVDWYRVF